MSEMAAAVDARSPAVLGPASLDALHIRGPTHGIAVAEALAVIAGVAAPLHTEGMEMFNALCGEDFGAANTLLLALRLEKMNRAALLAVG